MKASNGLTVFDCVIANESSSIAGRDIVIADSLFAAEVSRNFHLSPQSPAIDFCYQMTCVADIALECRGHDDPISANQLGTSDFGADEAIKHTLRTDSSGKLTHRRIMGRARSSPGTSPVGTLSPEVWILAGQPRDNRTAGHPGRPRQIHLSISRYPVSRGRPEVIWHKADRRHPDLRATIEPIGGLFSNKNS
jgi:hypothetical protein